MNAKRFDCIVCGSCTIDILVRPVDLQSAIGVGQLHRVDPIELMPGGIVSNAGLTLARLGMSSAAFSAVGRDRWGQIVRGIYREAGFDAEAIVTSDALPTSVSVVTIDSGGQRSFIHSQGAPKGLTIEDYRAALPMFTASRAMLLGYYPLLPGLLEHLPEFFAEVRASGCLVALDAAGGGGTLRPLDKLLPHLDVYCPSRVEAESQTGCTDPEAMIGVYRECGATGVLGIKLGDQGALLWSEPTGLLSIPAAVPPGLVVDTTGAGDVFLAGLLAGILSGLPLDRAGRLGAAAAAINTTALGGNTSRISRPAVARLSGFDWLETTAE